MRWWCRRRVRLGIGLASLIAAAGAGVACSARQGVGGAGTAGTVRSAPGDRCPPTCSFNFECRGGVCVFDRVPCVDDAECEAPYVCSDHLCSLPAGEACDQAAQCASLSCEWGYCAEPVTKSAPPEPPATHAL